MDNTKLPDGFQDLYKSINNEVTWIHAKWIVYRQIFASSEDNIELLNQSASFFFGIVQQTFFEDTLLGISRLTDPAKSFGKDNRSLAQLISKLSELDYQELAKDLGNDLSLIITSCESFREWRNRKIAHSDLDIALKVSSDPLPGISRATIEKSLEKVRDFMNRINNHFFDSHTIYEHFITHSGGDVLLGKLKIAEEVENTKRKKYLDLINQRKNNNTEP